MKKYPVLKCDERTWLDLKPILEDLGITDFSGVSSNFKNNPYLVSNYGNYFVNSVHIGNLSFPCIESKGSLRYLVNNVDEFITDFIKLLNGGVLIKDNTLSVKVIRSKERKYVDEVTRIHCPTIREATTVISIYHILGFHWSIGKDYSLFYTLYGNNTVYSISDNCIQYGNLATAVSLNRNIISAEEFINYYTNMEEKRNVQITKEQAREWYKSNNETLRTLALSVFKKEELEVYNFNHIYNSVLTESPSFYAVPMDESSKEAVINKLKVIAKFFNKDWKKTTYNEGYFIAGIDDNGILKITKHTSIKYPGLVYFKEKEYIDKAAEILKTDINILFD